MIMFIYQLVIFFEKEAKKPDSSYGKEINDDIKKGSLVPTGIACKLLEDVCLHFNLND